jgi:hypothetical protein
MRIQCGLLLWRQHTIERGGKLFLPILWRLVQPAIEIFSHLDISASVPECMIWLCWRREQREQREQQVLMWNALRLDAV